MAKLVSRLLLSAALLLPAQALAADLTIYWGKGFYPEEDRALEELVARFERKTGKDVELKLNATQTDEHPRAVAAAREAGEAPDVALSESLHPSKLAYEDALADLSDVVAPNKDQFFPAILDKALMKNGRTERYAYYGVPLQQFTINIHVWKSLLDQAGLRMEDIPREWDAFWAFWCDKVQPAVRRATGRDDIYGVGLPMSVDATDTLDSLEQFQDAYEGSYMTPDGKLLLDDADTRQRLVKALIDYTAFYRKGCTPPDSVKWTNLDNNKQFHEKKVVMTINATLSIPSALRAKQPDDYYKNMTSIDWQLVGQGKYPLEQGVWQAIVFKDAKHIDAAKEFLRFLVEGGELGPYLEASLGRNFPALRALLDTPFWQDPADPHRSMSARLLKEWPAAPDYAHIDWRHATVNEEKVWEKAVYRVAAEGLPPERAADEAIARIKQILSR